jgi:hypothetical protein
MCHHQPRSSVLPSPEPLQFFKVVFAEGVQHRLRFCLDHLIFQNGGISVSFSAEITGDEGEWGTIAMLFLVKEFPG